MEEVRLTLFSNVFLITIIITFPYF